MSAVEALDLGRTFRMQTGLLRRSREQVEAVRGVSFTIEPGELFGLLGPNGAGKTTTIKMLITLLLPSSGSARVLGHDVVDDVREVRRRIGYVFRGDRGLYERLSALDNLRYFSELYGVPPRANRRSGSDRCSSWSDSPAATGSASRATPEGCASDCTSPAGCSTTPTCSSSTSPRSASTRSARAS